MEDGGCGLFSLLYAADTHTMAQWLILCPIGRLDRDICQQQVYGLCSPVHLLLCDIHADGCLPFKSAADQSEGMAAGEICIANGDPGNSDRCEYRGGPGVFKGDRKRVEI